jgi:hypothetical protein
MEGFQDRCLKPLGHPSKSSNCGACFTDLGRRTLMVAKSVTNSPRSPWPGVG